MAEPSRRIALLADTHGHLDARIAAIARPCDLVVHAGDIGSAAILDELGGDGAEVRAIAGNNDTPRHWPSDDGAVLAALPRAREINLPGGTLVVVHGDRLRASDRHRRLRALHPQAGAVLYGHSHRAVADTDACPWILNPGAAGRTRTYGGPACLIVEVYGDRWSLTSHRFPLQR